MERSASDSIPGWMVMRRCLRLGVLLASAAAFAQPAWGQSLEALRQEFRQSLRRVHFAKSFAALIGVSDELELGSASYSFDNDVSTDVSSLTLPFHRSIKAWREHDPSLYLEGVVGYAKASERVADLYGGRVPALATGVATDWITYGALVGGGVEFEVAKGLTFAPIGNLGFSRIENETDYSGPGAQFTRGLADGLAFNWDAWTMIVGGAGRLDWEYPIDEHHHLSVIARYDLRWIHTIAEDDEAQDFATRTQLFTLRADATGPTGLSVFGRRLGWRVTGGYRRFFEGNFFSVRELVQIGGALELDTEGMLPVGRQLSLAASWIFGDDVRGISIGVGVSF